MKKDLYNNEEVFVIPYLYTQNIDNGYNLNLKDKKNIWSKYDTIGTYIPRSVAEGNREVQQLIPYIVIQSDTLKYFVYQVNKPDKKEYKNTMTLGISDHVKYEDGLKEPLFKAAMRCILENIDLKILRPIEFRGYVREMNGNISDHLGVVLKINDIPEDAIEIKTPDFVGKWMTKKELIEHYGKFENWSKHLINFMVDNNL